VKIVSDLIRQINGRSILDTVNLTAEEAASASSGEDTDDIYKFKSFTKHTFRAKEVWDNDMGRAKSLVGFGRDGGGSVSCPKRTAAFRISQ